MRRHFTSTMYTRICSLPIILVCVTLASAVPVVSPVQAQGKGAVVGHAANASPAPIDSAAAAEAATAAWARADTGRMMPGYRELSAYDTPGYCLAAIKGMEELTWRRGEADTLPQHTPVDTLPTVARDLGRTCLAKMTPQTVAPIELYNLIRLAVRLGDTALARQAVDYQLSITPATDARARGYVLADAVVEAATNRPILYEFMQSLLPRFAELGNGAIEAGAWAYGKAYNAAHQRFDTTAMLRFSAAREALIHKLTPEELKEQQLAKGGVFQDSLDIVWYKLVPDLSPTIKRLGDQWATAGGFADSEFAQMLVALATTQGTVPGLPAPTLEVIKRYPADASLTPARGKVTLVLPLSYIGIGRLDETLGRLRRLYERYHDRGFDVVLIGKTVGYAWGSPPLANEEEADLFGWYYREYLKLPFTVFVEETVFSKKPDGRKIAAPSQFMNLFQPVRNRGYIVGRDGTIKSINYGFHFESELEAYLLREFAAPIPTGG